MKPHGPIPPEFANAGRLTIGGQDFGTLVVAHGSPLFVYDMRVVAARIARFRAAFGRVGLHYAIKANPHPDLIAVIAPLVDGLDVASAGELDRALAAKPAAGISFAGPGKRDNELEAAITAGAAINLESEGEADRALAIAERVGKTPRLAVRVNPDFELKGSGMRMGGRASPFGIDADRAGVLARRLVEAGVDWRGFHIFAGSQTLDTAAVIEAQAATVALARRLSGEAGAAPPLVNLGGGFGIPYFEGDTPLDVEAIGAALLPLIDDGIDYAIELGRWLVGESGVYLTRVVDRKESRGQTFVVVDGGLHHQLAASGNFGTVVRRNYPIAVAAQVGEAIAETVTVVGCLCTPLDRLGDQVALPGTEVGDVIAIFLAGAYGLSASPTRFLDHSEPGEIIVGL